MAITIADSASPIVKGNLNADDHFGAIMAESSADTQKLPFNDDGCLLFAVRFAQSSGVSA